ncbi:MAG: hypothetical protein JXL97_16275 [Bacteroidales bacterium]|nr:hypothetical protein [Bacteroidales bacterium]
MKKITHILIIISFLFACNNEEQFQVINSSLQLSISIIDYEIGENFSIIIANYQETNDSLFYQIANNIRISTDDFFVKAEKAEKIDIEELETLQKLFEEALNVLEDANSIDFSYFNYAPNNKYPFSTNYLILKTNILRNFGEILKLYRARIEENYYDFVQEAVVIPKTIGYKLGKPFEIEIFVANHFQYTEYLMLEIDGEILTKSENGKFIYKIKPAKKGFNTIAGYILRQDPRTKEILKYPFEYSYYIEK